MGPHHLGSHSLWLGQVSNKLRPSDQRGAGCHPVLGLVARGRGTWALPTPLGPSPGRYQWQLVPPLGQQGSHPKHTDSIRSTATGPTFGSPGLLPTLSSRSVVCSSSFSLGYLVNEVSGNFFPPWAYSPGSWHGQSLQPRALVASGQEPATHVHSSPWSAQTELHYPFL